MHGFFLSRQWHHRRFLVTFGMRGTLSGMSTNSSATLFDLFKNGAASPDELAAKLVPSIWDNVEFRSAATPPIRAAVSYDPNGPPSPIMQWLQPTVILTGNAGRTVIRPYGGTGDGPNGTLVFWGFFAGIVGIGFVLGRLSK